MLLPSESALRQRACGRDSVVFGMNKVFVGEEEQKCREGDVECSKSQHLPDGPFVIWEVNQ